MQLFYSPSVDNLNVITLTGDESRHCISVLRMRKGDSLHVVDGRGNLYFAVIDEPDKDRCVLSVNKVIQGYGMRDYELHIGIAPTKNIDRFEWFLEKAVETGIDQITPVICEHSERRVVNQERLERIIQSAMKQSLKSYLPILHPVCNYSSFIDIQHPGKKAIAVCNRDDSVFLPEYIGKKDRGLILIGPEGDFSDNEVLRAIEKDFRPVSLGSSRFRTETAGVAACMSVYLANEGK